jgi:Tfp pilus assembly protein FimV
MFAERAFSVKHLAAPRRLGSVTPLRENPTMTATAAHLDPRPLTSRPLAPRALAPRARAPRPLAPGVYRRRRLVAAALLLILVLSALLVAGRSHRVDAGYEGPATPRAVYVVQAGDTLWSIAGALAPGVDTRRAVASLRAAAGGADLVPGQRIVVPSSLGG